jgi:uncharacterized protein (DUF1800 family)
MLIWLDNAVNRAGRPNENYARELMELFCLGVGHYTEQDVREVSRALTGWTVQGFRREDNYNGATFIDFPPFHDPGAKTIFGQTGPWDGYDAIAMILQLNDAQGSVSGRFLASRLWSFFAAPYPPASVVAELASIYVASNRSIREVLRRLFTMDEFYAPYTRKAWVRSPVEYAAASVRMLEGQSDFASAANSLPGMGQVLFNPEDAKGWDWGAAWLNTGTIFARAALTNTLCANRGNTGTRRGRAARDPDGLDRLHEPRRRRRSRDLDQHARQRRQKSPRPRPPDADEPGLPTRVRRRPWAGRAATS